MTFKELGIGQKFLAASMGRRKEWAKIQPVLFDNGRVRFNAQATDGSMIKFGHSTKVWLPPYAAATNSERQKSRYSRQTAVVRAKGWTSVSEFMTAIANGTVDVPNKI